MKMLYAVMLMTSNVYHQNIYDSVSNKNKANYFLA